MDIFFLHSFITSISLIEATAEVSKLHKAFENICNYLFLTTSIMLFNIKETLNGNK